MNDAFSWLDTKRLVPVEHYPTERVAVFLSTIKEVAVFSFVQNCALFFPAKTLQNFDVTVFFDRN